MIIKREIGEKGQVVIPKDIRKFLDLKEREKIIFELKENEVVLKKEQDPIEVFEDFFNVSGKEIKTPSMAIKELKKIHEEQYGEEIH
tara:strand:+ start:668 stop:928 length:261 start_codon:yes stop_codon:yes gene_type:complete